MITSMKPTHGSVPFKHSVVRRRTPSKFYDSRSSHRMMYNWKTIITIGGYKSFLKSNIHNIFIDSRSKSWFPSTARGKKLTHKRLVIEEVFFVLSQCQCWGGHIPELVSNISNEHQGTHSLRQGSKTFPQLELSEWSKNCQKSGRPQWQSKNCH